jgi:AraC-like DNA-binding protein
MGRLDDSRIRARARASVLADGFAACASTSLAWTFHAPHGATVYAGLDADVTVTEPGRPPVRGRVVVAPPDRAHAAACPGPAVALRFDPEVASPVATYARAAGGPFPLEPRHRSRVADALVVNRASLARADVLDGLARETGAWLSTQAPDRHVDARVARAIEALLEACTAGWGLDPAALAGPSERVRLPAAGISPAHLRALFVRDVGVPMRSFQLWHRLLAAVGAFSRIDATTAAHAAGFSDLAHFSRTSRRLLGDSPTGLARALLR